MTDKPRERKLTLVPGGVDTTGHLEPRDLADRARDAAAGVWNG